MDAFPFARGNALRIAGALLRVGALALGAFASSAFASSALGRSQSPEEATLDRAAGRVRFDSPLDDTKIQAELEALIAAHPDLVVLESLGTSAAGRDIPLLSITDRASGAPGSKPALFALDFQPPGRGLGAEAVLSLAWALAERQGSEEWIRTLLRETTVYLAPMLDPDARAVAAPSEAHVPAAALRRSDRPVEFDLNFPLGWQPDTLRPGSGSFPLSSPESLAVARFLSERDNLALLVGAMRGPERGDRRGSSLVADGDLWNGAECPTADAELFVNLAAAAEARGGAPLLPWNRVGSTGGSLSDYAFQALGVYPFAWSPAIGPELVPERWIAGAVDQSLTLLSRLPKLELESVGLVELEPHLWQLDLALSNAGVVPTLGTLAQSRGIAGELRFAVTGAQLTASMQSDGGPKDFESPVLYGLASEGADESAQPRTFACGSLDGKATRWIRLLLEADAGSEVVIEGGALRAGQATLRIVLER